MTFNSNQVDKWLGIVGETLNPILEQDAPNVIAKAKASLASTVQYFKSAEPRVIGEGSGRRWGFIIAPSEPLRFVDREVGGLWIRVDLFAKIYWCEEFPDQPCEANIAIRVWALDEKVYFRSGWDANEIRDSVDRNAGRVMLRFHFDLADRNQDGPRYHLQIGGNPQEGEFCWFPESLALPRFPHLPMDLILAAELIAANFYPEQYIDIRREPSWRHAVKTSQEHMCSKYLQTVSRALQEGKSMLDSVWNVEWGE